MVETQDYDKSATPLAHKTSHENGGSDEISVDELSGQLADDQPSSWALVSSKPTTFAPEAHKTSHQDGGTDEISVTGLSGLLADPQTNYSDRGDPSAHDWSQATITTDGAWHDLDCSPIAPAGTKAVIVRVTINHATLTGQYLFLRKKGNSNTINSGLILTQAAGVSINSQFIVPCNSDRVIEYSGPSTTFAIIAITIIGWFY